MNFQHGQEEEERQLHSPQRDVWVGHLIKSVFFSMRREVERILQPKGLTHTQWFALGLLNKRPGLTHGELEKLLHIGRPSVTSLVNGMVRNGWAVRKTHAGDARVKRIFLTAEGSRLAEETADVTWQVERRMRESLPADGLQVMREMLEKMLNSFE
jgi:DNA-binding MarR family transcriptional regulator